MKEEKYISRGDVILYSTQEAKKTQNRDGTTTYIYPAHHPWHLAGWIERRRDYGYSSMEWLELEDYKPGENYIHPYANTGPRCNYIGAGLLGNVRRSKLKAIERVARRRGEEKEILRIYESLSDWDIVATDKPGSLDSTEAIEKFMLPLWEKLRKKRKNIKCPALTERFLSEIEMPPLLLTDGPTNLCLYQYVSMDEVKAIIDHSGAGEIEIAAKKIISLRCRELRLVSYGRIEADSRWWTFYRHLKEALIIIQGNY